VLDAIRQRAEQEAMRLAGQFAKAAAEDKEAILAGLEFEQWLAESCRDCQRAPKNC
jgi:hypothetical protein